MVHPGGRPPKFTDPKELDALIEDYFNSPKRFRTKYTKDGKAIEVPIYTITGLMIHLGFCDRSSFYDNLKKPEFSHSLKMARARIEQFYELLLQDGLGAGAIFALKNFGWRDVQENKHSGEMSFNLLESKIKDKVDELDES